MFSLSSCPTFEAQFSLKLKTFFYTHKINGKDPQLLWKYFINTARLGLNCRNGLLTESPFHATPIACWSREGDGSELSVRMVERSLFWKHRRLWFEPLHLPYTSWIPRNWNISKHSWHYFPFLTLMHKTKMHFAKGTGAENI